MNSPACQSPGFEWFLLAFAAMWIGVAALLSRIGGWGELAERFPTRAQPIAETFRIASLGLGKGWFPVSYSNCLSASVGPEGFGLSLWPPFRAFHPNLFIPWRAVERCGEEKVWFVNCTALYVTEPSTRMLFNGRVGRALQAQWATFNATHVQSAPAADGAARR
jgi:hypothetical protein